MTPALIEPEVSGRSLHDLRPGDHWCELYHHDQEHLALLKQFFADGLAQNHKLLYMADPELARAQLAELERSGLKLADALARGQLVTCSPDAAYLVQGRFERARMFQQWEQQCATALAEGYAALRAAGEPTWALAHVPGSEELPLYEAELNDFAATHPCIIFCQYDARRFPPNILLDVLRSHPVAVLDNAVLENPYFVPPEEARNDRREAAKLVRWVAHLREGEREERRAQERAAVSTSPGAARALRRLGALAAWGALVVAVLVLAGYAFGIRLLTSFGGDVGARPVAAVGIALAAVALWLRLRAGGGTIAARVWQACAAVTALLGFLALLEWSTGRSLGIDQLLFDAQLHLWQPLYPGRLSLPTALGFVLLGGALLLLDWEPRRGLRPAQWAAIACALISVIALQGYTFGVSHLSDFGLPIAISLPAAAGLALLSLGTLFARPDAGAMRVVSSGQAGGAVLRWALPLTLGAIWFLAWFTQWGLDQGLYPPGVDQLLFALPLILLFTYALSRLARMLNRAGERQQEQHLQLEAFNRELETRVEHRTARLVETSAALQAEVAQRRQSEDKLREQAALLELANDAIFVRDLANHVLYWNHGAEETYGFQRDEALGTVTHDLLRTVFPVPLAAIDAELWQRGEWQGELRHTCRDGHQIVVASRWSLQRDEQGTPRAVLEINRDITGRKRSEEELHRLNRAYKALSRCTDAVTRAASEGTLLQEVCDLAVQVGGYRLVWVGYAQEDEEKSVLPMALAGDGADYVCDARITWADNERGQGPTGIALRTGEPRFVADIATSAGLAPWREAALAHGYHSVMTAPLKDAGRPFGTLNFYAGEPDAFDAEERGLVVELAATLSHAVLALRARAERDRATAEIRALNESLERRVEERTAALAAANQELEAFTYSVAHDLRAPLRHIHGFVTLLDEDYAPRLDETAREYVQHIVRGSQQMGQLIDDLLNLSRVGRQQLQPQVVGLNRLVDDVRAQLAPDAAGRQVTWKVGDLPFVECDATLVRQVFQNLLANALKFTRPRAEAVIEIGRIERDGQDVLFVRDNGVGFNMKYADKLFGVFQRLHRQEDFEGTGVGLVTVQRILHKHGGRVWAEAELDHGATFYFTLGTPIEAPVREAAGECHASASR